MARPRSGNQQIRENPSTGYGTGVAAASAQQANPLPAPPSPGEAVAQSQTASPGVPAPTGTPVDPAAVDPNALPPGFTPPSSMPNVFGPSTAPGTPTPILPPFQQYGVISALFSRFPNPDLARLREQIANMASRPPR